MKIIKIAALILIAVFTFVYFNFLSSYVFPWQEKDAIKLATDWGGLSNIPKNAKNIEVEKEGSTFTKTYIIEFNSTKSEIDNWIETSKRLKSSKPKIENGKILFEIYPGEKASFGGKVEIEKNKVKIKMSWS